MAIAINVADKKEIARQDTFQVPPADIIRGENSRVITAADYTSTVRERAISIFTNGQLQPAEARRNDEKKLVLTLGFTRLDAVELLREGFEHNGVKYHKPDLKLWVKVVDCSPEEAFIRGIIENNERKDVSDLQEAKAHAILRDMYKKTDTEISKIYGYTNLNRTMALRKLLTLDNKVQQLVHANKLALSAALLTLDVPAEEREALLDGATDVKGNVRGEVLKRLIRDAAERKAEAAEPTGPLGGEGGDGDGGDEGTQEPAGKTKSLKRSTKELQTWIQERIDEGDEQKEGEEGAASTNALLFLKHLSLWMDGHKKFSTKKLNELFAVL